MSPDPVGLSLRDGFDLSGMTVEQAWLRYVGLGGAEGPAELARQIRSPVAIDDYEHDVIAQALNEHFLDLGQDHPVGYSPRMARRPLLEP
jgi:hypothetical protein